MTLNSSGPISLGGATAGQSINLELGQSATATTSLNATNVRTLAGVASGAIIMPTNFYGKSNSYIYTVSTNRTNFCMRAGAVTAGWNGTSNLVVNISGGVVITGNSTGTPAMTISGAFPGGVTVNNSGTIVAQGGNGGGGYGNGNNPNPGGGGGTALYVRSPVTINNPGVIAGGGGGGGGGGSFNGDNSRGGGGGGGGRTGLNNSGGGGGGYGNGYCCSNGQCNSGGPGGDGTYNSAGGGGGGSPAGSGEPGGPGGGWGAGGATGPGQAPNGARGYGGGAGKATCGAPTYITWSSTGTRYGSIS